MISRLTATGIIENISPKWFVEEIEDVISERREEGYSEDYQPNYDIIDWLMDGYGFLWEEPRTERFVKKIDKALGVFVQVKEGDEVYEMGVGKIRVGRWVHNKRYDELIETI